MSTPTGCTAERHEQATAVPALQWGDKWATLNCGTRVEILPPKAGRLTKTGRRSLAHIRYRIAGHHQIVPRALARMSQGAQNLKFHPDNPKGHAGTALVSRRGSLA